MFMRVIWQGEEAEEILRSQEGSAVKRDAESTRYLNDENEERTSQQSFEQEEDDERQDFEDEEQFEEQQSEEEEQNKAKAETEEEENEEEEKENEDEEKKEEKEEKEEEEDIERDIGTQRADAEKDEEAELFHRDIVTVHRKPVGHDEVEQEAQDEGQEEEQMMESSSSGSWESGAEDENLGAGERSVAVARETTADIPVNRLSVVPQSDKRQKQQPAKMALRGQQLLLF